MMGVLSKELSEPKNGKWKEFNKHAVLIAEGIFVNGQKHGLWREYYDTGELMIEEYYEHGIQHGQFASFHPNGQIYSKGQYLHGSREGCFRVYNEEGKNIRNLLFIKNTKVEDTDEDQENSREQARNSA